MTVRSPAVLVPGCLRSGRRNGFPPAESTERCDSASAPRRLHPRVTAGGAGSSRGLSRARGRRPPRDLTWPSVCACVCVCVCVCPHPLFSQGHRSVCPRVALVTLLCLNYLFHGTISRCSHVLGLGGRAFSMCFEGTQLSPSQGVSLLEFEVLWLLASLGSRGARGSCLGGD